MISYLQNYVERIKKNINVNLAESILENAKKISTQYIQTFNFQEHVRSLLVGEVQSGKTSQMFGIMCAAADESFGIFVLLTTDNVVLQQQTILRAKKDLCDFCICDENDWVKFSENKFSKPIVIVLKKNSNILRKWKNYLITGDLAKGNPIFIVDDEADASSLNTKVNQKKQSTINKHLDELCQSFNSSIYLEVTGTPQALLLQSVQSNWKPYFLNYFKPGDNYIGGNILFSKLPPIKNIVLTDDDEAKDLLADDEFPENGLKQALITFLVTSAQLFLTGKAVCNFLIHPSVRTEQHSFFAEKVGSYLNEINLNIDCDETVETFKESYFNLASTKPNMHEFNSIYQFVRNCLENDKINILILNSTTNFEQNTKYTSGINIIVGGNSLGRGITFPQLQTIYYCRVAKNPQADTMWQHARMFGYDRDLELLRIYMPPKLYTVFYELNKVNNSIVAQIFRMELNNLSFSYKKGIKPTRNNVIDKKAINIYTGNTNYFPFYAENKDISYLDRFLANFPDGEYDVSLKIISKILENNNVTDETSRWNAKIFLGFIDSLLADNSLAQGKLIVRRNRDITKGTGTLLSPNDRKLGDNITDRVVLTMYKVTGDKGWNGEQIWIPNIKLPGIDVLYYSGD